MSHFHECPSCHCSYVCHADCTVEGNGYGARSECGPCGPPRVTDYVRGRADALRDFREWLKLDHGNRFRSTYQAALDALEIYGDRE